ncbi:glycerol-3-phosphate acyltransferase, partial [Enterococcus cecorum]|nr:glycerol-3-phosphate acyltransferase [Enterococcus cecorum]
YICPSLLTKLNVLLTINTISVSAFIFYRHKDNIKRIKNGTESRVPFGLNSSKNNPQK